jgi:hypothetical protein
MIKRTVFSAVLLVVMTSIFAAIAWAEMDVSLFRQTDAVGPEKSADLYMLNYEIVPDKDRVINPAVTLGVLYDREPQDLYMKVGLGARLKYKSFYIPISGTIIPGGGRIKGLATASAYLETGIGVEVIKNLSAEFRHISSPFDGSGHDDKGLNFIGIRYSF